jgi:hypothetical protein
MGKLTQLDVSELLDKTKALQEEMHQTVEWIMSNSKRVSYQDAVTVYLLFKISELQGQTGKEVSDESK